MEICLHQWNTAGFREHKEDSDHGIRINISVPTKSAVHLRVLSYKRLLNCLQPEARFLVCQQYKRTSLPTNTAPV